MRWHITIIVVSCSSSEEFRGVSFCLLFISQQPSEGKLGWEKMLTQDHPVSFMAMEIWTPVFQFVVYHLLLQHMVLSKLGKGCLKYWDSWNLLLPSQFGSMPAPSVPFFPGLWWPCYSYPCLPHNFQAALLPCASWVIVIEQRVQNWNG